MHTYTIIDMYSLLASVQCHYGIVHYTYSDIDKENLKAPYDNVKVGSK